MHEQVKEGGKGQGLRKRFYGRWETRLLGKPILPNTWHLITVIFYNFHKQTKKSIENEDLLLRTYPSLCPDNRIAKELM